MATNIFRKIRKKDSTGKSERRPAGKSTELRCDERTVSSETKPPLARVRTRRSVLHAAAQSWDPCRIECTATAIVHLIAYLALSDGQRVCDAFERLAYLRGERWRRRADTPDFAAALEVMGTMQGDVLGRAATEEEQRNPQLGRVLLRRSAAHPLDAGVVGDVLAILQHLAAFNLPVHAGILGVVQAIRMQGVGEDRRARPKRQVERRCQPATTAGNEEVHESPGWIIEAHHVGGVLGGDVEVVVGTKRDSDGDEEVAAGVGKEVDERARRRVVAPDAKIASER